MACTLVTGLRFLLGTDAVGVTCVAITGLFVLRSRGLRATNREEAYLCRQWKLERRSCTNWPISWETIKNLVM
ncbi:hypothetical protein GOP47_0012352 [Adiantum capillus-veneris]|uniref:Uncharacterized protein n=1 Tax=Adiantum capillus-veneris TaxID=13818 RepID=A0A9D4UQS0_ADICA|nr:hypothetical protein GOP47_0012352 [Adiantum capillus-veneris]